MREILFRGKRKADGQWVLGAFCPKNSQGRPCIIDLTSGYWYPIDPETIGQWTDMVDKNGVKVFEGDVVESIFTKKAYTVCYGSYTYINEYEEEEYAWGWYNTDEDGFVTAFALPGEWAIVIGNIHDKAVEE